MSLTSFNWEAFFILFFCKRACDMIAFWPWDISLFFFFFIYTPPWSHDHRYSNWWWVSKSRYSIGEDLLFFQVLSFLLNWLRSWIIFIRDIRCPKSKYSCAFRGCAWCTVCVAFWCNGANNGVKIKLHQLVKSSSLTWAHCLHSVERHYFFCNIIVFWSSVQGLVSIIIILI